MSSGQKSFLMWVAIILFVAYLANINLGHAAGNFLNSVQTIHNSNAHP
jgi:FtsH-binding integral membrane protein